MGKECGDSGLKDRGFDRMTRGSRLGFLGGVEESSSTDAELRRRRRVDGTVD